jgi:ABC-type transport system involved in cytochrome bd biosynthesis fused ATPase/permease subunit
VPKMNRLLGMAYTPNQMSYDLARLRLNGLIQRRPRTNTYDLTPDGQRVALFYTKVHSRLLRRVAIARAIVGERTLLLADEPTGALDSETGEAVLNLLRDRCDHDGIAGVLVTHEARHAAWADRVVYLRDGVLVGQVGPMEPVESLLEEAR